VIPNFVDPGLFRRLPGREVREQLGLGDDRIVIHISNFRPVKCIMDVLKVFRNISSRLGATLLLVGDGPDRSDAETWVRANGLTGNVRFLGKLDDIVPLLSVSDLMLMPSNAESFGLAALEAMACGVPVVATAAGGFPEFIEHGTHGFLLNPGDVEAMTEKALLLLTDEGMWNHFSDEAVKQAGQFDTARLVEKYETFYRSLMEAGTCG
jgi:N-acetyl-alpha-D-glucosaminyl L-malate synthase BshA